MKIMHVIMFICNNLKTIKEKRVFKATNIKKNIYIYIYEKKNSAKHVLER